MPYQRLVMNFKRTGTIRREKLHGRTHVVAPVASIAEGVWEGSNGPLFYPAAELRKSPGVWNHKPIVIYHPDENGTPVSACSQHVLNTRGVGLLLESKYDDKLRHEAWFDEDRLKEVDVRVLNAMEAGEPVEVSTGVEVDLKESSGEFGGKPYVGIALNYRPDHLACLPDKAGAYSVKDGGGLLTINQSRRPERTQNIVRRSIECAVQAFGGKLVGNELSFSDVSSQLWELLAQKFGQPGKYWEGYVVEVYPDYVVFRDSYGSPGYQMIGYKITGDTVELVGSAEQVERVVEYKVVNGRAYVRNAAGLLVPKEVEGEDMAFDKAKYITSLIGNGVWTEADKPALEALPDAALQKITSPKPPEQGSNVTNAGGSQNTQQTTTAPQGTPATVTQTPAQQTPLTTEQYIANAPPGVREVLQDSVATMVAEKERLVKEILTYPLNGFSEQQLRATPVQNLRTIAHMIPKQQSQFDGGYSPLVGEGSMPIQNVGMHQQQVNYAGAAGGAYITANSAPPDVFLPSPEMDFGDSKAAAK